jgi:hypothetical protein
MRPDPGVATGASCVCISGCHIRHSVVGCSHGTVTWSLRQELLIKLICLLARGLCTAAANIYFLLPVRAARNTSRKSSNIKSSTMVALSLLAAALLALNPVSALWPEPTNITTGTQTWFLDEDIPVTYNGQPVCFTSIVRLKTSF